LSVGWTILAQTVADGVEAEPDTTGVAIALTILVTFLASISAWSIWRRRRRIAGLPAVAAAAGLHYSAEDRFSCATGNFDLFRDGHGRLVEHVLWRDGSQARVFDYAYFREQRDKNGRITRTWTHFTCATTRHPGRWPDLSLLQERRVDRALRTVGLGDVELESEEFNRRFLVRCADAKFATDLLDPQMMELLLAAPDGINLEVRGPNVLAWSRLRPPEEFPAMLELVERFVELVPPVVADLYDQQHPDLPDLADLGLRPTSPEKWRDPIWNGIGSTGGGLRFGNPSTSPPRPWLGTWSAEDDRRRRETREASDTDRQEYDLDGRPVGPPVEDPWGDGLPPRTDGPPAPP